jgi:hypothetical protein
MLRKEFQARFKDFEEYSKDIRLFQNPLTFEMEEASEIYQLELIDMQTNDEMKEAFHSSTREQLYRCLSDSKILKVLATKMLTVFGSTYICEQTFSRMKLIKLKLRTRMTNDHLHHCLRVCHQLSNRHHTFLLLNFSLKLLTKIKVEYQNF